MMPRKILSFSSILMGLFLLVLFFMPWLELSGVHGKQTPKFGEASGWQIALGLITPYGKQGKPTTDPDHIKAFNDAIRLRPWFLLALAAPLAIAAVGSAAVLSRIEHLQTGWMLTVLGLVGLATVLLALGVDYYYDIHEQDKHEMRERMVRAGESQAKVDEAMAKLESEREEYLKMHKETGEGFKTSSMVWLSVTLVGYVVLTFLGLGELLVARMEANQERGDGRAGSMQ